MNFALEGGDESPHSKSRHPLRRGRYSPHRKLHQLEALKYENVSQQASRLTSQKTDKLFQEPTA
jgi:hypothetical protein